MKIHAVTDFKEILPVCSNAICILKWHQNLGNRNLYSIKKIQKGDLAVSIPANNCSHNAECSSYIRAMLTEKLFALETQYR